MWCIYIYIYICTKSDWEYYYCRGSRFDYSHRISKSNWNPASLTIELPIDEPR